MEQNKVITANDLIGIPFKMGGRDKSEGVDCYWVVQEMAKRLGFCLPDINTPDDAETRLTILKKMQNEFVLPVDKPELYAIVVFSPGQFYCSNIHCGMIYPDVQSFIHAGGLSLKKSIRVNSFVWPYKNRIFGYFRLIKKCQ